MVEVKKLEDKTEGGVKPDAETTGTKKPSKSDPETEIKAFRELIAKSYSEISEEAEYLSMGILGIDAELLHPMNMAYIGRHKRTH